MRHVPTPKRGCFTAQYPSNEWKETQCGTAPHVLYAPPRHSRLQTVGNLTDVSAQVSGFISESVGSFDSVTGVTSETGGGNANAFSLQLNSNRFNTPLCSGAADPSICKGWQQFVYANFSCGFAGCAFIQYWLINYVNACPAGWNSVAGIDCVLNSSSSFLGFGHQSITSLANFTLTGQAVAGGNDTLILGFGATLVSITADDAILNLSQGWQQTEFNVLGDGNGTQAVFNSGASITVRTSADSGPTAAPTCSNQGTSGETNNLSFATAPVAVPGKFPAVVFTESTTGTAATPCDSATAVNGFAHVDDFDGSGMADILWHNSATGQLLVWEMNGATASAKLRAGSLATAWQTAGVGDFDGDGKVDILWHNGGTGQLTIWEMNGAIATAKLRAGNLPTAWQVAGVGDFDGDGKADILWYNGSTGQVVIWEMDGATAKAKFKAGGLPTAWQIAGVGDFDGDGKADILWHNSTTGQLVIWEMNGGTAKAKLRAGNLPTAWQVAGVADFDGDGNADILWHNGTTGTAEVWEMNGATATAKLNAGSLPTAWQVVATGDYNGDHKADILWRNNSSGIVQVWEMNGGTATAKLTVDRISTAWQIQR
jgi:hypothetical protein